MLPLMVLVITFGILLLVGRMGVTRLGDWLTCLRWALAAMFVFTASAHFGPQRADLIRMVPDGLPAPGVLVTLTGFAELAGAIGLVIPRVAPLAATALAVFLIAVFPANVHAAAEGVEISGRAVMGALPRGILQVFFLVAVLIAGFTPRWRNHLRTSS
jgi:uncharacterized membrane protein